MIDASVKISIITPSGKAKRKIIVEDVRYLIDRLSGCKRDRSVDKNTYTRSGVPGNYDMLRLSMLGIIINGKFNGNYMHPCFGEYVGARVYRLDIPDEKIEEIYNYLITVDKVEITVKP